MKIFKAILAILVLTMILSMLTGVLYFWLSPDGSGGFITLNFNAPAAVIIFGSIIGGFIGVFTWVFSLSFYFLEGVIFRKDKRSFAGIGIFSFLIGALYAFICFYDLWTSGRFGSWPIRYTAPVILACFLMGAVPTFGSLAVVRKFFGRFDPN